MKEKTIFTWIARSEGISLLVLLFIAMPLKYWWGNPILVQIVGMLHGLLFLAYVGVVILWRVHFQWNISVTAMALIASVLPGGTFVFEYKVFEK